MIPFAPQRVAEQRVRLNPQGLARKDKPLMSAIKPDPGHVFVSCDLSSGEPTCTSHYSQDRNYFDACFGLVGKEPFYERDLLRIGNIYAMVASVAPTGKARMRELFHTSFKGVPFPQAFAKNADLVKETDPKFYAFHKIGALGMSYGMGARKFQSAAYDAGYNISFSEAKGFFQSYWSTFPRVRQFADKCAAGFKSRGYLVNDFGYRLLPDKEHKAFNYWIQSSVSGIMHVLCAQFFALAPFCTFLLVIHDEVIFSCPVDRVEEARAAMRQAEDQLNAMLQWRVRVRVGFKAGGNLYEAK